MPFQLSPGVAVVEKDFSSIVPAVSTSAGAFAGIFTWGPVLDPVTITSENNLVARFGKPTDANATSFFTAANFLSYTNNLLIARVDTELNKNAVATPTGAVTGITLTTSGGIAGGIGYTTAPIVTLEAPDIAGGIQATATCTVSATVSRTISQVAVNSEVVTVTTSADHGFTAGNTVKVAATTNTEINGIFVIATTPTTDSFTYELLGADDLVEEADTGSVIKGGTITGFTITQGGSGYSTNPTATFSSVAAGGTAAVATGTIASVGVKINNFDAYTDTYANGGGTFGEWAAKYPGAYGNSLKVSIVDNDSWEYDVTGGAFVVGDTYTVKTLGDTDWEAAGASSATPAIGSTFVAATVGDGTGTATRKWDYQAEFDAAPDTSAYATSLNSTNDEVHVIVTDKDGVWTGTKGAILEKFSFLSKASDAKKTDGSNNYYKDVINSQSKYIWWMDHATDGTNWGTAAQDVNFAGLTEPVYSPLSGGVDDLTATDGQKMAGFEIFANDELYDVSLIPVGKASATVAEYVINNVAEVRKDCVVFVSPENKDSGDIIYGSTVSEMVEDVNAYRNELPSTSYAVLDSGYKYQYDRYNDKYRWVPLNGDVAGLCARTDYTNDPWYSPGGYNRGQIKNVVKLAINPGKTERDNLYKNGVNPIVNFPGQGVVLFGDKTLLSKPSAFDRINVRRLFIVLEKAIATAAKYQLFEFNDSFTRAQFKNLVEPFLRDVQGRRGIIDFRVKCDDTNNTGEVIDRNEFIADIFIKPARSINFITLNFVAARTSVNFEEIGA